MDNINDRFHIFYLKLADKLPVWYGSVAEHFFDRNINLVDIDYAEFSTYLSRGEKIHLLVIANNQRERKIIEKRLLTKLGMAIRSNRISFYYVSPIPSLANFKLLSVQKNFFFFPMPIKMQELARRVREIYLRGSGKDNKWPGGNRIGLLDILEGKK